MSHQVANIDHTNFYDIDKIRADFPALNTKVYNKELIYLDNGATAQKPTAVTDLMQRLSSLENSSVHRGVHYLSAQMTDMYEKARLTLASFLGAKSVDEIVFTSNATDAFNLMANSWGRANLTSKDAILLSEMEHHANIVPWQLLSQQLGFEIRVAPITDQGELDLEAFEKLLDEKVKLVSVTHTSNALGTITPAQKLVKMAHQVGAKILLDGSQACVHMPLNMVELDVDFYIGTGHKLYGPTGIGFLYGKLDLLNEMPPWKGGGDMIASVSFEETTYKPAPARFEAGTPPYIEAIGLGAALDYVQKIGMDAIYHYEQELYQKSLPLLQEIEGFELYGQAPHKACLFSFNLQGIHPHDVAAILDRFGVAVRVGHHCAQPLMKRLGVSATIRASYGLYNRIEDTIKLAEALQTARRMFG